MSEKDMISRQAAIDELRKCQTYKFSATEPRMIMLADAEEAIEDLPSAQPTLCGYKIEHLAYIASVMKKEGVTAEYAVRTFDDMGRVVKMVIDETRDITRDIVERSIFNGSDKQTGCD